MLSAETADARERQLFYIDLLKGTTCRCGNMKRPKMALCLKCWYRLPGRLRCRLYGRMGSGFEASYEAACKYLDEGKTDDPQH
jgi:hypothetical protein